MKHLENCEIITSENIKSDIYKMTLKTPQIAKGSKPGQFVMIYLDNGVNLLPRPISIADVDGENLTIIYHVVGDGTKKLSQMKKGDIVRILGSLGNGFDVDAKSEKALLIGGGIGTPPMYLLARHLISLGVEVDVVAGFRNMDQVILQKEFEALGAKVHIATDDGSAGFEGNVVELLNNNPQINHQVAYACGPTPMLKGVAGWAKESGTKLFVSLEERMACGIGACFACISKNKDGVNKKVCIDGPVFEAKSHFGEV
ncbi:MAG: dihydroorotate dehydrogenase electron transfer subunit [Defluviitaleaceae bacterium]|nr:dihydroorotate dehydrogenase electron transfer subunit [Defluviitaleaceae bacterium]